VFRWRIQASATKNQTNNNDRNSKFQTDDPPAFVVKKLYREIFAIIIGLNL
jgi:hypothetical protein